MLESNKTQLRVQSQPCGSIDGEPLYLITLFNDDITVKLTNFGALIMGIFTADQNGEYANIVAGYVSLDDYQKNPHYFGCILGRYAGRISGSRFELDGDVVFLTRNDGRNHLHGGFEGFNKKVWKIKSFIQEETETGVIMEYLSPDGDEGYPGDLWVTVKYILDKDNKLTILYDAVSDKSTPVNLSNHSYFNLTGFKSDNVLKHTLQINAATYTESNIEDLPTGKILSVNGSPLDFTIPKQIGADISGVMASGGYNHNFVINDYSQGTSRLIATLSEQTSGRMVEIFSDMPGMQLYTANDWRGNIIGSQGYPYQKHAAIALETQYFPDSPNHSEFHDTILRPEQRFMSETSYAFSLIKN